MGQALAPAPGASGGPSARLGRPICEAHEGELRRQAGQGWPGARCGRFFRSPRNSSRRLHSARAGSGRWAAPLERVEDASGVVHRAAFEAGSAAFVASGRPSGRRYCVDLSGCRGGRGVSRSGATALASWRWYDVAPKAESYTVQRSCLRDARRSTRETVVDRMQLPPLMLPPTMPNSRGAKAPVMTAAVARARGRRRGRRRADGRAESPISRTARSFTRLLGAFSPGFWAQIGRTYLLPGFREKTTTFLSKFVRAATLP